MSAFKKFLLVFVCGALLVGGYFFVSGDRVLFFDLKTGNFAAAFRDIKNNYFSRSTQKIGDTIQSGRASIKEKANEKKKSVFQSFAESVENGLHSIGESLGITGSASSSATSTRISGGAGVSAFENVSVLPSAKVDTPLSFVMSAESKAASIPYSIDWKDGHIDRGTLGTKEKIVTHAWDRTGIYEVEFLIGEGSHKLTVSVVQ